METKPFARKCWCENCETFTMISFSKMGGQIKSERWIVFRWECPQCEDSDVSRMKEEDWFYLVEGKYSHYNPTFY